MHERAMTEMERMLGLWSAQEDGVRAAPRLAPADPRDRHGRVVLLHARPEPAPVSLSVRVVLSYQDHHQPVSAVMVHRPVAARPAARFCWPRRPPCPRCTDRSLTTSSHLGS